MLPRARKCTLPAQKTKKAHAQYPGLCYSPGVCTLFAYFCWRKKLMSTILEIQASVDALNVKLNTVSQKLDDIAALVLGLEANAVSQEQIDALKAAVDTATATVDGVAAKEEGI